MIYTQMPIMGATLLGHIPFDLISPHEAQAQANHHQTLHRLAGRGGLSVCEALAILEDRPWREYKDSIEAQRLLINKVREWRASLAAAKGAAS